MYFGYPEIGINLRWYLTQSNYKDIKTVGLDIG